MVECGEIWPSERAFSGESDAELALPQHTLKGGLMISAEKAEKGYGTLGIVRNIGGTPTALSCAHVMLRSQPADAVSYGVIQPGAPQGGTYPADSIGTVLKHRISTDNLDAAIVRIEGRDYIDSTIRKIDGRVKGCSDDACMDMMVIKMGARTGLTKGVIKSTTYSTKYKTPLGKSI